MQPGGLQSQENSKIEQTQQQQMSVRFQDGSLIPSYELAILDKLRSIDEFRAAKRQLEKNLDQLKKTYESDPKKQKRLKQMGGPSLQ